MTKRELKQQVKTIKWLLDKVEVHFRYDNLCSVDELLEETIKVTEKIRVRIKEEIM